MIAHDRRAVLALRRVAEAAQGQKRNRDHRGCAASICYSVHERAILSKNAAASQMRGTSNQSVASGGSLSESEY